MLDVPGTPYEPRQRLEAIFEPECPVDEPTRQMMATAAQLAGLLLEIERAHGRWPLGKELIARQIHEWSRRRNGPFVAVR